MEKVGEKKRIQAPVRSFWENKSQTSVVLELRLDSFATFSKSC